MIYLRIARSLTLAVLLVAPIADAAHAQRPLTAREGFVNVPGGPVWYRIFGSGTKTPLLIVHGGPGSRSCAYDPLAELVSHNRPVVVYDQLGTGRSGRPSDRSLWTVDRSVRELAAVRKALGLTRIHLMGHSWGGALVAEYAIKTRPQGIESLVLAGPLLSTEIWIQDANALRALLPVDVQKVLTRNEAAGTTKSPEYEAATNLFYQRFLVHQANVSSPPSCAGSPRNDEIYQLMWGPTEFRATGSLVGFDVTHDLGKLHMPILFLVGRYDEARPETVARFQALIPGAQLHIFENSGHMAPLEEANEYSQVLEDLFKRVDQTSDR